MPQRFLPDTYLGASISISVVAKFNFQTILGIDVFWFYVYNYRVWNQLLEKVSTLNPKHDFS